MTNSYPTGSPVIPDANMPTGAPGFMPRRSSYASVVSGAAPGQSYPRSGAFSHLLNQHIDSSFDPAYQTLSGHPRNDPRAYDMDFGANGSGHGRSGSWTRGGQLPSFSSAFGSLVNGYGYAGAGGNVDHFFVPSYLKGSKYVQKLEEAHRAKVAAHRDGHSAPSSQPGSLSTSASSVNLHSKMAPSHRGMTYDVIEKAPPMEDETLPSLPSRWNIQDRHAGVEVLSDGQEVKFTGSKSDRDRDHEASAIRADHPMPPQCGIYYYEVTIISRKREESSIGIGFSSKSVPLSRLPGWEPDSWAYHGDDGHSFCCQSVGKQYGPSFTTPDVVGCGVNFRTGSAFFTKNGVYLGPAFREINNKGKLYPSVGMKKTGEHIRVNFGQSPFVFDIDGMMAASNNSHYLILLPPQHPSYSTLYPGHDRADDPPTPPPPPAPEAHQPENNSLLDMAPTSDILTYSDSLPPFGNRTVELDNILEQQYQTAMDSSSQLDSESRVLASSSWEALPPLVSPPLLPVRPQTNATTSNQDGISPIRTVPRTLGVRPYLPIGSFSTIRDVAQAELVRSGTNLESSGDLYRELLRKMRSLFAESLTNAGSTIVDPSLSPEAVQTLNRIVRVELRGARAREETARLRAQVDEGQETAISQERSLRSQEISSSLQLPIHEAMVEQFHFIDIPNILDNRHERFLAEVSMLRAETLESQIQVVQHLVGTGSDQTSSSSDPFVHHDAAQQHAVDLQSLITWNGRSRPASHSSSIVGFNDVQNREMQRRLAAAQLANPSNARNAARRSHLQGHFTLQDTGPVISETSSYIGVPTPYTRFGVMRTYLQQMEALIREPGALDIRRGGDMLDNCTRNLKSRDFRTMTDIEIQQEKLQIRQDIEAASTSKIAPPMSETELIQSLVLQFLTHDGYVETARAFADEVHAEKRALSLDPNAVVHGFDVREDEDAGHRQRIRAAVLEGDVDKALKHTNAYYPHVLKDNEHVYFRLRCRKFIEMIRQGAEMQNATTNNSKKNNGHNGDWYDDILNHDMELDDHQSQSNNWDRMDTEDSSEHQAEYQRLLEDTLAYGRDLQAEFKDDQRREVSKALEDAFALMAYTDPLNAKEVSHQLDPSGRVAVAEELNSAILQSLGKSSSAALEQLYQQTSILLEDLREGGGPGAFVNIDDFVRPKP